MRIFLFACGGGDARARAIKQAGERAGGRDDQTRAAAAVAIERQMRAHLATAGGANLAFVLRASDQRADGNGARACKRVHKSLTRAHWRSGGGRYKSA